MFATLPLLYKFALTAVFILIPNRLNYFNLGNRILLKGLNRAAPTFEIVLFILKGIVKKFFKGKY